MEAPLRLVLPDIIISNAVYDDQDRDKYIQHPDLVDMLTYCSTMEYGNCSQDIIGNVKWFNKNDKTVLIPMNKLCAGVQAGPAKTNFFAFFAASREIGGGYA
jgi:hypothetical protein